MKSRTFLYCATLHVILFLLPQFVHGQIGDKKGHRTKSKISFYYTPRFYLNGINVNNDDVVPNSISNRHSLTFNSNFAIEYQRTASSGFLYGFGAEIGNRSHQIQVRSSLGYLDTFSYLKGIDTTLNYGHKTMYTGLRVFLGYRKPFNHFGLKNWDIEIRLGLSKNAYMSGNTFSTDIGAQYLRHDSIIHIQPYVIRVTGTWGNGGRSGLLGPWVSDLHLGFSKNIEKGIIQDLNIGLTGTFRVIYPFKQKRDSWYVPSGQITVTNFHNIDGQRQKEDTDIFDSYELSFGLRLGIGLRL